MSPFDITLSKKVKEYPYFHQMLTDFKEVLSLAQLRRKFIIKPLLKISLYLKLDATILYEISVLEDSVS